MKNLFSLLASAAIVWIAVIGVSIYIPTVTGVHSAGTQATYFLRWMPGVSIAMLSGTIGALFNGLMEIWLMAPTGRRRSKSATSANVHFVVRPVLGAIAGLILFLFFAAGGLSLMPSAAQPVDDWGGSTGTLLYQLTPRSTSQLATTILLTLVGGYFFPLVPHILEAYRNTALPKVQSKGGE